MTEATKTRILHVVNQLERGGITTWLMNVVRRMDRERFETDFVVHSNESGAYDEEALSLGARIFPCASHRSPWAYANELLAILRTNGPYDTLHSHCHLFGGYLLMIAEKARIPQRIAHSHATTRMPGFKDPIFRKAYYAVMKRLLRRYLTTGLAVSRQAAEDLFGDNWTSDPRCRILSCGIDTSGFRYVTDREAVRKEIGLPSDALVVGHVGRFTVQKNYPFLVDVFSQALKREPRLRLVLVGNGPGELFVTEMVNRKGLSDFVVFTGSRSDVPRLMLGAFDLFLFPSLSEGLGLALVEAQAAGLPCLASDTIPPEADVVPELVSRLPLVLSAEDWAEEIVRRIHTPRPISRSEALSYVEVSPFEISLSVKALEEVYSSAGSISRCNRGMRIDRS